MSSVTHVNGRVEPLEPEDGSDLLGRYFAQVAQTELLTAEEEVDLAKAIEAGVYADHLLAEDGSIPARRRAELEAIT